MDDDGNITRITHEDGSYWDYGYDGRNRLISADRKSSSTNIVAEYDYTYDDADNMLTKVEPFEDDFEDGAYTGWSVWGGTWSASNKYLAKTATGNGAIAKNTTDADGEVRLDYRVTNTSTTDVGLVRLRSIAPDDYLYVEIKPAQMRLIKKIGSVWTVLDTQAISTTQNQWYTLRAEYDGANATVWRNTEGELETELLTTTSAAPTTTSSVMLGISSGGSTGNTYEFDNVRILVDNLDNSTTFAYNTANELTSMAGPNGTTTFTYDDWGRQITKTLNSVTDTYAYRYGSKLYSVDLATDSNLDVTFDYGGDQNRRSTTAGGVTTGYNWDIGWNVINEENGSGTLARTYFHNRQASGRATLAHVDGTSPATGAYDYYTHDHLGSTRALYSQGKSLLSEYEYSPFGGSYASQNGSATSHRFGGHYWNDVSQSYVLPFRTYAPSNSSWLSRDPSGTIDSTNLYAFVGQNPVRYIDYLGLKKTCTTLGWGDVSRTESPEGDATCGDFVFTSPIGNGVGTNIRRGFVKVSQRIKIRILQMKILFCSEMRWNRDECGNDVPEFRSWSETKTRTVTRYRTDTWTYNLKCLVSANFGFGCWYTDPCTGAYRMASGRIDPPI